MSAVGGVTGGGVHQGSNSAWAVGAGVDCESGSGAASFAGIVSAMDAGTGSGSGGVFQWSLMRGWPVSKWGGGIHSH